MQDTNVNAAPQTLAEALAAIAQLRAEQRAAAALKPVAAAPAARSRDAWGAPLGTGTNQLHAALAEGWAQGVGLKTGELAKLTTRGAVGSHLQTLKRKGLIVSTAEGYTMSEHGAALWHGQGKGWAFAQQAAPATPPADLPVAAPSDAIAAPATVADDAPPADAPADAPPADAPRKGKRSK